MTDGRQLRIAAVGDLHFDHSNRGSLTNIFTEMNDAADVIALCGDLTTSGNPEEMRGFVGELSGVDVPIVAVLGNHDHEADRTAELTDILRERGIEVLRGESTVIEGVGFAGVKGFAGGFGAAALAPFGERLIKDFVQHAIDDSLAMEKALRKLETERKVALLHYSPVTDTIEGEPEPIHPFLGSSRLLDPLDTFGASVILHGHAHHGSLEGSTPGGTPVYNVSLPLLREKANRSFLLWSTPAPERRKIA